MSKVKAIPCVSAKGKSNIIRTLQANQNDSKIKLVIVDGAAFGSEMKEVMEYVNVFENVVLYAPESFEWLLLASNVISDKEITDILKNQKIILKVKSMLAGKGFLQRY